MVKDKHAKALDFMVNMNFGDFDAEKKQCGYHPHFLGKDISPSNAKNFLPALPMIYGLALQKMMMKR